MPISQANLKNNKRTVTGEYYGETFTVTYKPSEYTLAVQSGIDNPDTDETSNEKLINLLTNMLTAWDVLDEKGDPLPITPEILADLPVALLGAIQMCCREDMTPKARNGRR